MPRTFGEVKGKNRLYMLLLLEIAGSELGFLLQRLTPVVARLIHLSLSFQRVPQV